MVADETGDAAKSHQIMSDDTRIWGLGMGPGDPDLITLKSLKILQAADVVAYPAPADGDSLVRQIAAPHMSGTQREIVISTPMVVERYPAQDVYDQARDQIAEEAAKGHNIAVLCQGDPFFYGSFMYLFLRLAEDWPVKVVPGVNSLTACAAELGMPLAARNDVITVIPATLPEDALKARISQTDVAVIMKVGRHLEKVRQIISELGLMDRARYIERATMENQKLGKLEEIGGDAAPYFSMILVRCVGDMLDLG